MSIHTASVVPHELPNVLPWVHRDQQCQTTALGMYYKVKPSIYSTTSISSVTSSTGVTGENQFDRLLIAAASCAPDFKSRIYNRTIGIIILYYYGNDYLAMFAIKSLCSFLYYIILVVMDILCFI